MDNPLRNWDYAGISSLCRELNMPAGAEGAMMDALKGVNAAKLLEEKDALRDYETGEAATRRVQQALSPLDPLKRGYIELGLSLQAALDARARLSRGRHSRRNLPGHHGLLFPLCART